MNLPALTAPWLASPTGVASLLTPAGPVGSGLLAGAATGQVHAFWYASRALGLLATVLLAAATIWGLLVTTRIAHPDLPGWLATDLHRFLSILGLGAAGLHGGVLLLDQQGGFGIKELLVPGAASYQPLWTAAGVVSMYLLVGVGASFGLRRWLPGGLWRRLHYLSYPGMGLALAHAVGAGTDVSSVWVRSLLLLVGAALLFFVYVRLLYDPASEKPAAPRHSTTAGQSHGGSRAAVQPAPVREPVIRP